MRSKPIKRTFITTLLAISTLAVTTARAGILDDWGQSTLVKEFYWCRIKFHREGTHIISITLDHKNKESGNAYFHGGECYSLMLSVARGPGSRVNFKKDVTTDDIWVDNVTGNRLTVGYRFSPRLADIGGTRFWRIDPKADYGQFNWTQTPPL